MSNASEDRLRAAFEEAAESVRPELLRPLSPPERRRRRSWPAPLVAATAVLVSVGLAMTVLGDGRPNPAASGGGPAFIVAVGGFNQRPQGLSRLEVRDARTGRLHATQAAPQGRTFQLVAAAGDHRTFFALEVPTPQSGCDDNRVYRMKVGDDGRISAFSRVDGQVRGGTMVAGASLSTGMLAASPDGRKVAFAVTRCDAPGKDLFRIGVIDTKSGAQREWTDSKAGNISSLSWAADGRRLAFLRRDLVHHPGDADTFRNGTVRLLDTEATGDLGSTKVLVQERHPLGRLWAASIAGNGEKVTVVAEDERADGAMTVCEVSASTGSVDRTLYRAEEPVDGADPGAEWGVALKNDGSDRRFLYMHGPDGSYGRIDDGIYHDLPVGEYFDTYHDFAW